MFDVETQSELFNEYVSDGVVSQIRALSKMFDQIKKDWKQVTVSGEFATQKLMMGASQSARAGTTSQYPTPAESDVGKTTVYIKRAQMFTLKFDGLALEAAEMNGTPISPIEFEKKGIWQTISNDMSRQLVGDGSGRICQANGAGVATQTLVIDSPDYANLKKFFRAKRVIDIYTAGGVKEVDSVEIESVDSGTQLTLKNPVSWSNNSWIYNEDVYTGSEGCGLGEMMGIGGIMSEDDPPLPNAAAGLQGLLVAGYPEWTSHVFDNGGVGRDLVEDLITEMLDDVEDYSQVDVMLTTKGIRRVWLSLLQSYKSLPNQKVFWGGWSGLPFYYDGREIPIVTEKFIPDGCMKAISNDSLIMHVLNPKIVTWEKGDAQNILQKVSGKNEFQAEGHIFSNLATDLRKAFGDLRDLNEP